MILFQGKEVLYLTKEQAAAQSNFNLSAFQLRERFKTALKREERLHELWKETSEQLQAKKELVITLEKTIEVREEELKDLQKNYKKQKRKKFIQNTSIGIVIGIIGTLLLTN